MYRKFWLTNSLNNRYDLTVKDKAFMYTPTGLGFKKAYNSMMVGNSELITTQSYMMTDIEAELLFNLGSNGADYQGYQDFIQFCKYRPLVLHYLTPNNLDAYHCDVLFVSAEKGEISFEDSMLHIPVVFHRLTEWLKDSDSYYSMNNDLIGDGKYYDYEYDYFYAGTNLSGQPIYNNGTDAVGFVLTIEGDTVQNPQFTLSQGGEVYGICKITGTYDYVMIDSVERTESIYLEYNGSAVTNPEQYQDFTVANGQSYLTWIKLRVGESVFAFTCGNIDTFAGIVTLSFKESYVSV